jgi:hypothetical protein
VSRGLLCGIPDHPRDLIQLIARFVRDPTQHGQLDIILRAFNAFESRLANPENREKLIAYLIQQDPIPKEIPWFTWEILQFWTLWGLLCGHSDVLRGIRLDLSPYVERPFFLPQLQRASWELWLDGYINYDADGKLIPTTTSKKWIFARVKIEDNPRYKVILVRGENTIDLGNIEYRTLLKHCLKGQILPWEGQIYAIMQIDTEECKVHVKRVPLRRKRYFTNRLKTTLHREKLYLFDQQNGLALLEVKITQGVKSGDKQWKGSLEEAPPPLLHSYPALLIRDASPLPAALDSPSIEGLVTQLQVTLHIESSELDLLDYQDPLLGSGVLVLDKSRIKLAQLMFDYLQYKTRGLHPRNRDVTVKTNPDTFREGLYPLPFFKGMEKLKRFLEVYQVVIAFIADFHIDDKPFTINGQHVDFRAFCRALLQPLTIVNTAAVKQFALVFLGDTMDWIWSKNHSLVLSRFYSLVEVLEELGLREKTVFIRGNHDPSEKIFVWRRPLSIRKKLTFEVSISSAVTIEHGDTLRLEKYSQGGLTEEKIMAWRNELKIPEKNHIILGHAHMGRCFHKANTLLVPALKRYCQHPANAQLGWLGLFGYGNPYHPEISEIEIDS